MVAHSMELDELLFSSFFMDHGNNNELKEISSNFLQAAICVVAAQDNTMTFTLKRPTGTDIRFTALVFLSNQSFNLSLIHI